MSTSIKLDGGCVIKHPVAQRRLIPTVIIATIRKAIPIQNYTYKLCASFK